MKAGDYYVNKKTGGKYRILSIAIDTTNERDGTEVVVYFGDTLYVRELTECEPSAGQAQRLLSSDSFFFLLRRDGTVSLSNG